MNRPLVPRFLKKLDKKLLINHPDTWSARTHLVVWYSLLVGMAVLIFNFIAFNDPRRYLQSETTLLFTILISVIGFVIWLIFVLRFNVFKRFGEYRFGNGLKTFLLFFVAIFFIILPNYIPFVVESWKANMKYTSDELVHDANRMNELMVMQHQNLIPSGWEVDSVFVGENVVNRNGDIETVVTVEVNRLYISRSQLQNTLENSDSTVKINDSTYLIYECPELKFVSAYDADRHSNAAFLSSRQLYDKIILTKMDVEPNKTQAELNALIEKYGAGWYSYSGYYNSDEDNYKGVLDRKYGLNHINRAIENISTKKYLFDPETLALCIRLIFYCSFCLSILLFIFRHTTIKTFFLSVLTVILLMILNGIILSFTSSTELAFLTAVIWNYILLAFIMIATLGTKYRSVIAGISLNLVTAFTAFIPLLCVFTYYELLNDSNRDMMVTYEDKSPHLFMAEIGGILLFIVLLEPVFKKLYRKWYALPEN
jgi:hypothetical protein